MEARVRTQLDSLRRSRRIIWAVATLTTLLALSATPSLALADEAGDDIAHPAGPLVGGVATDGRIDTNTDVDWWKLYTNPQRPIDIAVTRVGTVCSSTFIATLRDENGNGLDTEFVAANATKRFNFTTPTSARRYYVTVSQGGCTGQNYRILIQGADATTTIAPSPEPGQTEAMEREPNDNVTQANGPMKGATAYGGVIGTNTDVDWWKFYTNPQKPLDVMVTRVGSACSSTFVATLRDGDGNGIDTEFVAPNTSAHFNLTTPVAPSRYYVTVSQGGCNGGTYQLRADTAEAISPMEPPADADKDGVPDASDRCLLEAGDPPSGCPDTDGDGITDNVDQCRNSKGAAPTGCPDTDDDGIPDETDECDRIPGVAPSGCPPPDRDGDGIIDSVDQCDTAKGPAPSGCPDGDGDGVVDGKDRCPATAGAGADGCSAQTRHRTSASLARQGVRYSGRVRSPGAGCVANRRVVLRVVGQGKRSYGTDRTSQNGAYMISRSRRVKGKVYVVVLPRDAGSTTCQEGRSRNVRG